MNEMEKEYFTYDEPYTFVDNDGKDVEFNFIEEVLVDGTHYAFFAPVETQDGLETDEVVGFIVEDTGDEEFTLKPITSEAELDKAFAEFIKKINEISEECDDEECEGDCDCCEDDCDCDEDCQCEDDCDCDEDDGKCDCGCGHKK